MYNRPLKTFVPNIRLWPAKKRSQEALQLECNHEENIEHIK